jgi:hypothetical protein
VGSVGFEPTTSSAPGWHPAKLDDDPSLSLVAITSYIL